jgi:hypothetical protein
MVSSKPARSPRRLIGLCLASLLLSACQPSLEQVVAEHRPAVEGVFARIKALDAAARSAPPLAEDKVTASPGSVVLDGDNSNALFILASDLAAPEHASSDATGATRAAAVQACGEALRGQFNGVPKGADLYLQECGRAQYLFVLRTHLEEAAQLIDKDSFQAGQYGGDVLLFRLADGAALGGFRVSAASNDSVQALVDENGNPVDVAGRLDSDLSANAFVDIEDKLRTVVPGSIK